MQITRRVALMSAAVLAASGTVLALNTTPVQAHGAMMIPGSRQYLCWQDAITGSGAIAPTNAACAAAIAKSGQNMIYNWFADLRSNAGGRNVGYIPDGQICSGGGPASDSPFDFSGYNLTRNDWPVTHLTSGASITWWYSDWAKHPGSFNVWITKSTYDPTKALAWSDLEDQPFMSVTDPAAIGGPGSNDGHYQWTGNLPSGRSGRYLIYSQWVRSDSQENFFGCSDVVFDGGNGQVTGIHGSSSGTTTTTQPVTTTTTTPQGGTTTTTTQQGTTTTTTRATTTTTSRTGGGNGTCTAGFSTASRWDAGFVGSVTVTANSALSGWRVTANLPGGTTVTNTWNAARTGTSGAVTFANLSYNAVLSAGQSTNFGFQANGSASGVTVSCASP